MCQMGHLSYLSHDSQSHMTNSTSLVTFVIRVTQTCSMCHICHAKCPICHIYHVDVSDMSHSTHVQPLPRISGMGGEVAHNPQAKMDFARKFCGRDSFRPQSTGWSRLPVESHKFRGEGVSVHIYHVDVSDRGGGQVRGRSGKNRRPKKVARLPFLSFFPKWLPIKKRSPKNCSEGESSVPPNAEGGQYIDPYPHMDRTFFSF
jgi:hypothetical protein